MVISACALGPTPAQQSTAKGSGIEVTGAYINATTINGALYFEVTNRSDTADKLVGIETDVAEVAELHESKLDENDVARMSPVEAIDLPAGGTATLAPGGLHVMLIGIDQNLAASDKVNVTLDFEEADSVTIEAEVQQGMAMDHNHESEAMDHGEEEMDHHHEDEAMAEHDHGDSRIPNDGAIIKISSPKDGMEFQLGDDVLVEIEVKNFELGEEGNHWHVYIDDQSWGMVLGQDTDEVLRGLEPGTHEISAYLSLGTHEELAEGDKITVTVVE